MNDIAYGVFNKTQQEYPTQVICHDWQVAIFPIKDEAENFITRCLKQFPKHTRDDYVIKEMQLEWT